MGEAGLGMLMELAASQVQHQKQLPSTVPDLLERIGQELTCSICLDMYHDPMITHCGHVFCGECIMRAAAVNSRCPLCKSTCSKRMVRPSECTGKLVSHYANLSALLANYERSITGPSAKRRRKAVPSRLSSRMVCSPEEEDEEGCPSSTYIDGLRCINERIMSEINRIDQQLEASQTQQTMAISAETQAIIDGIEFPSSPVIDNSTSPTMMMLSSGLSVCTPAQTPVVTTTMLEGSEKELVREWALRMGAIFVSQYSEAVTHVIAKSAAPNSRLAVRSMKTMQAVVHGNWLLPMAYIQQSMAHGAFLKEDPFELEGDQYSDDEGPRRSRLSHSNGESSLFDGLAVYLFGTFGAPSKPDLIALLRSAGATIIDSVDALATHKPADPQVLVVGDPNECYDLEKDQGVIERFTFVQTEWIYCSISSYELLDYQHFRFL